MPAVSVGSYHMASWYYKCTLSVVHTYSDDFQILRYKPDDMRNKSILHTHKPTVTYKPVNWCSLLGTCKPTHIFICREKSCIILTLGTTDIGTPDMWLHGTSLISVTSLKVQLATSIKKELWLFKYNLPISFNIRVLSWRLTWQNCHLSQMFCKHTSLK